MMIVVYLPMAKSVAMSDSRDSVPHSERAAWRRFISWLHTGSHWSSDGGTAVPTETDPCGHVSGSCLLGGFRPRLAVPSEVALRPSGDTHTRGLVHADDL
jgi:hypothetical protein